MCTSDRVRTCGNLPFLALLGYSNVSKIKFSSICFYYDPKRTTRSRDNKKNGFNKKKLKKTRRGRPH